MHGRNGHRLAQVGSGWEGRPSPWGAGRKGSGFLLGCRLVAPRCCPSNPLSACPSPPAAPCAVLHITRGGTDHASKDSGRFSQHGQAGCIDFIIICNIYNNQNSCWEAKAGLAPLISLSNALLLMGEVHPGTFPPLCSPV